MIKLENVSKTYRTDKVETLALKDISLHVKKGDFLSIMDEIGELARPDQVKLLRVLQDQSYRPIGASASEQADVRVVSATNRELAELVASGDFREDLYYRLNLITLRLPALRERRSDIALIASRLVADIARDYGLGEVALTPAALDWLGAQPWPGNIRQLRQVLERTLLLAGKAQLDAADFREDEKLRGEDVGAAFGRDFSVSPHLTLEQAERRMTVVADVGHNSISGDSQYPLLLSAP